jgi:hypothetical protein
VPLFSLMRLLSHSFTLGDGLCVGDKTRSLTCDRPFVLSVLTACSTPHPIHWSSQPAPDYPSSFPLHPPQHHLYKPSNLASLQPSSATSQHNKHHFTTHREHEIQVQGRAPVSRCLSPRRSRNVTTNTPSQLREAQGPILPILPSHNVSQY